MDRFKFRIWDELGKRFTKEPMITCFGWGLAFLVKGGAYIHDQRLDKTYTIQQSTGFVDKNGKEIYEGDIIAVRPKSDKELYTVVWDESRFSIVDKNGIDILTVPYGIIPMTKDEMSEYRVIGNIFENPELIK